KVSFAALRIDPDGDGPVVGQGDLHPGTKNAAPNGSAETTLQLLAKAVIPLLSECWGRGLRERGSVAFPGAGVERKLTNDENCAADIIQRTIHRAILVRENPQAGNFARQPLNVFVRIFRFYPQENNQPDTDFGDLAPVDEDGCLVDALDQCSHGELVAKRG